MKKVRIILRRGLTGVTAGITIGFLIALFFSYLYGTRNFVPSSPNFVSQFTSNTIATAVSAILWALMGFVFSAASIVFDHENWSITKRTFTHFIITYIFFTPLAIMAGWYELDLIGIIEYTLYFIIIYIVVWISSMISAKYRVKKINKIIEQRKKFLSN